MSSALLLPTIAARWAAAALLSYDILITLEREINLLWFSSLTIPKCLYFLIRYLGVAWAIFNCAVSLTPQSNERCSCVIYNVANTTWLLVAAAAGDALLMLRVLALLKDKRRACIALKAVYGMIYSLEFGLLCYDLSHSPDSSTGYTPNLGCTDVVTSQTAPEISQLLLPIAMGPVLILNVVLLAVVVVKILPQYRSAGDFVTPLLTLILRDGAIYFVAMCCSLAFVVVTPLAFWAYPGTSIMGLPLFLVISPIAACRLFLNLRQQAAKPFRDSSVRIPSPVIFNDYSGESSTGTGYYSDRTAVLVVDLEHGKDPRANRGEHSVD